MHLPATPAHPRDCGLVARLANADDQPTVPQPSGNCLRDILFFDHLPPPQPIDN